MAKKAFPRDPKLTAIAIAFTNTDDAMVADAIFPRSEVGTEAFEWTKYPVGTFLTVPETKIGAKGRAARVEFSGDVVTSSTEDHALEVPLSNKDIEQAAPNVDPRGSATELGTKLMLLRREIRVAALVQDPANYAGSNKLDLATYEAGAHAWDDPNSNPLKDLREYRGSMLMPFNFLAMGHAAWLALSSHPKVVSACLGNDGVNGFATKEAICKQLEISDIFVGASFVNANLPKADGSASLSRVWGHNCLGFRRDSTASFANKAMTFGLTAQVGTRMSGVTEVAPGKMGLDGGIEVLSGEKVKECMISADCGFLLQNVLG